MKEMKKDSEQMQSHESVMESETIQKNGASLKNWKSRENFKLFTLLTFIMLFGFNAIAQDVIIFKNGDEIKSIVQEIGQDYIKYKKFDNQTGPVYNLPVSEIFMIKFANGSKEVFNEPEKQPNTQAVRSGQLSKGVKQEMQKQGESVNLDVYKDLVILDGKIIDYDQVCSILTSNDLLANEKALDFYMSGYAQHRAGSVLLGMGATFSFVGAGFIVPYLFNKQAIYGIIGGVFLGTGLFCLIPAVSLNSSGHHKIKTAIDIYNNSIQPKRKSDLSLNFGVTRSGGLGFTFNF